MDNPASFNAGEEFEAEVRSILALRGDMIVTTHKRIGGKDVDIFCTARTAIGTEQTMVFECKDYGRPMSRKRVAEEIAEYWPLVNNDKIDQFVLVTRNGIVANAQGVFDNRKTHHMSLAELTHQILRPDSLLRSMSEVFEHDLKKYYIPTRCRTIDLAWTSEHYKLLHSDFIEFAIQSQLLDYSNARDQWLELTEGTPENNQHEMYSDDLFGRVLKARSMSATTQLEPLVKAWVDDERIEQSLALIGSYGTGKSSFAKKLAHTYARHFNVSASGRIPILIELRNFGGHQSIEGLIVHEIQQRYGLTMWTFDTFRKLNDSGRLLLILDGFDEMKHGLSQDALFYNFAQIGRLSSERAKVIICGRPTIFSSDEEQARILVGKSPSYLEHSASYIQIDISSFAIDETIEFLNRFTLRKREKAAQATLGKIQRLADLSLQNQEIAELLSRPVHLPMIATLLPSLEINSRELRRARVYDRFIAHSIAREIAKQQRPHPSSDDHNKFAQELALVMMSNGESRSLRYSEVTDALILPFLRRGQTIDECRRELISACFLERKSPDILYFPHKSFAEFLVAKALLRRIQSPNGGTTGLVDVMSAEVISFLRELLTPRDIRKMTLECGNNVELLEKLTTADDARVINMLLDPEVIETIAPRILEFPKVLLFLLLQVWKSRGRSNSKIRTVVERMTPYLTGALLVLANDISKRAQIAD
ncbi:MAG TPA: NACHT domain-containing protein [Pseudonocardiaceae bacterium]|nr:NACHT domain-containing protein [Pseudonocardiaceae bacterium]